MKSIRLLARVLPALALVSLFPAQSVAQQTQYERSNQYEESYRVGYNNTVTTSNKSITHKPSKWWNLRTSSGISQEAKDLDTFDDENQWATNPNTSTRIQPAHVYVDTIYMEKGSSINLTMPTKNGAVTSVRSYQRWYNYRTEGTFRTNQTGGYRAGAYDLLTPGGDRTAYRFENGYVGNPLVGIVTADEGGNDFATGLNEVSFYYPTDTEYRNWGSTEINPDNDMYLVACDASSYLDFRNDGQPGYRAFLSNDRTNPIEPTLGHRVIFYIIGVDEEDVTWGGEFAPLKSDQAYQSTGANAKYLEEYNIVFPFTRICNNTNDLVALSKDAQAWDIPGVSGNISVSIPSDENTAGIELLTTSLSGASRIIHFTYPNQRRSDGTRYVDTPSDGSTPSATIIVRKGGYNLARYRLTFAHETQLLTQQQVANLDNGSADRNAYWYYPERTPQYLREHYTLLTSLTWDYDKAAADAAYNGERGYYPFPMSWDYSSYAFYDGGTRASYNNGSFRGDFIGQSNIPQWGYYAIMDRVDGVYWINNKAPQEPPTNLGKDPSTYHVYVDASDRPGTIARLTFPERLCPGSELFVSAWIMSLSSQGDNGGDDAGVLFTVMGVRTVNGRKVYTPIYRHASGQVPNTTYLSSSIPGGGNNQWMQVYFSFINEVPENAVEFEEYCLQIDNNCASTSGGDFCIDDVQVYIQNPTADVTQLEATCTGENTLMNVEMNWDRLASHMGNTNATSGEDAIDFCFIDKTVYDNYLAEHPDEEELRALQAAVELLGPNEDNLKEVTTFYYRIPFTDNTQYDTDNPRSDENLAANNVTDGKYYFRRVGGTGQDEAALSLNFYSSLMPYRPYYMLIREHRTDGTPTLSDFVGVLNDDCGMYATFDVGSETLVKVDGEVVRPSADFCVGQIFNFSAQLRVPYVGPDGEETYFTVENGAYFDWFFGTYDEFLAEQAEYGGASLQSALVDFRAAYPNAEAVDENTPSGNVPSAIDPSATIEFTEDEYKLLRHYSTTTVEGLNPMLVLHRERLDISIQEDGLDLVVCPIQTVLPPEGLPDEIGAKEWAAVCWEPIPLSLTVSGAAPELHAGFNTFYPTPDFNPALRIGLKQIEEMSGNNSNLRISLRGAKVASEGADWLGKVETQPGYDKVYLIGTDDPAYAGFFTENFDSRSLPIGIVEDLHAEEYVSGTTFNDYANIRFDLSEQTLEDGKTFQFSPREGYTYQFSIYFEEKSRNPDEAMTSCYGKFNVDMKIVPEYVVWNGTETDNWNNDLMWKRADAADFHSEGNYTTNAANGSDNAFVPMLFTKVIVPRGKSVELYRAGVSGMDVDGNSQWDSSRPAYIGAPTENIQYDLMTYENEGGDWTTERYRVTLCDQIHLEPGAEVLHAEQLIHNTAWTDVELAPEQWRLLSTPLTGVYAGDWYTQTTGQQATEYFQPITFGNGYDRLQPAVFQRSMGSAARIVEDGGGETPVSFGTAWSSVYNDAAVPYGYGAGFSLSAKAVAGSGNLLFRLPKADTRYEVATGAISRPAGSGKFAVAQMIDRSDPNTLPDVEARPLTVTLTPSADGRYFIVGNPFPAHLDVKRFLEENSSVLAQKYWLIEDNGPVAGSADDAGNWVDASGDGTVLLPPYGAFYAERADEGTGSVTVNFTADMQAFAPASDGTGAGSQTSGVRIQAQTESGRSMATVAYSEQAENDYMAQEDVQLLRDAALNGADQPYVYTVAGTKATAVNRVRDVRQIPIGVFAADGEAVTLTFTGLDHVESASLYDAERQSERTLHEGDELSLTGSSHGRYFLRLVPAEPTGIAGVTDGEESITVYSVTAGEVIASAPEALTRVEVYDTAGRRVRTLNGTGDTVLRADGLTAGTYVVRAATASAQRTVKLVVE